MRAAAMGQLLSYQNFGLKTDKLDDWRRNSQASKPARPAAPGALTMGCRFPGWPISRSNWCRPYAVCRCSYRY